MVSPLILGSLECYQTKTFFNLYNDYVEDYVEENINYLDSRNLVNFNFMRWTLSRTHLKRYRQSVYVSDDVSYMTYGFYVE